MSVSMSAAAAAAANDRSEVISEVMGDELTRGLLPIDEQNEEEEDDGSSPMHSRRGSGGGRRCGFCFCF